jgi:threonine dehydrogenase-like Zn-dependent dehydrogenase
MWNKAKTKWIAIGARALENGIVATARQVAIRSIRKVPTVWVQISRNNCDKFMGLNLVSFIRDALARVSKMYPNSLAHHGYGCECFRIDPRFAVRIDPALGDLGVLLEPMAVVAKAWKHVERMSSKDWFKPRLALVTGAGPVGLLAALLAHQRGFETHVMDLVNEGAKPAW